MSKLIRTVAPKSIRAFHLEELQGKILAIDALLFIYEIKYRMKCNKNATLRDVFIQKVSPFLEFAKGVVFVFDGVKPREKHLTVLKRKLEKQKIKQKMKSVVDPTSLAMLNLQVVEVFAKDIYEIKDIIKQKSNKLMMVQSNDEGEATCVKLVKEGFADIILTSDTDTLACGESYIRKCRTDEMANYNASYLYTDLNYLRNKLEFTSHEQFLDCCVLLGCDFSNPLKKIRCSKIPGLIRDHGSLENVLAICSNENFTSDLNSAEALKRSKELFMNVLGGYKTSLPLNHRAHHLQQLLMMNSMKEKAPPPPVNTSLNSLF
jgi:flap endonuclease-1